VPASQAKPHVANGASLIKAVGETLVLCMNAEHSLQMYVCAAHLLMKTNENVAIDIST